MQFFPLVYRKCPSRRIYISAKRERLMTSASSMRLKKARASVCVCVPALQYIWKCSFCQKPRFGTASSSTMRELLHSTPRRSERASKRERIYPVCADGGGIHSRDGLSRSLDGFYGYLRESRASRGFRYQRILRNSSTLYIFTVFVCAAAG